VIILMLRLASTAALRLPMRPALSATSPLSLSVSVSSLAN
jgi:hypothetical protein